VRLRSPSPFLAAALFAGAASGALAAPVRVALVPVTVHSNDAAAGYLSAGLASMLSARLEQFDELSVVRIEAPTTGRGQETAQAAAREAGADFVVFGSFTQFGEGASLDLQCARVEGGEDARRVFVQSGTLGEIIPKLDELAEKIRLYVSGGGSPSSAATSEPAGPAGLADLQRRVETLERTVFRSGPEQGPSGPPAQRTQPGDARAP
jgi:TolB-like protein